MTLADYNDLGTWDYFRSLVRDLGLEAEFEEAWGESLDGFELEVSETIAIEETLDEAHRTYVLAVSERTPAYRVLRLE